MCTARDGGGGGGDIEDTRSEDDGGRKERAQCVRRAVEAVEGIKDASGEDD